MSAVYERIAPLVLQERADHIARERVMELENIKALERTKAEIVSMLSHQKLNKEI